MAFFPSSLIIGDSAASSESHEPMASHDSRPSRSSITLAAGGWWVLSIACCIVLGVVVVTVPAAESLSAPLILGLTALLIVPFFPFLCVRGLVNDGPERATSVDPLIGVLQSVVIMGLCLPCILRIPEVVLESLFWSIFGVICLTYAFWLLARKTRNSFLEDALTRLSAFLVPPLIVLIGGTALCGESLCGSFTCIWSPYRSAKVFLGSIAAFNGMCGSLTRSLDLPVAMSQWLLMSLQIAVTVIQSTTKSAASLSLCFAVALAAELILVGVSCKRFYGLDRSAATRRIKLVSIAFSSTRAAIYTVLTVILSLVHFSIVRDVQTVYFSVFLPPIVVALAVSGGLFLHLSGHRTLETATTVPTEVEADADENHAMLTMGDGHGPEEGERPVPVPDSESDRPLSDIGEPLSEAEEPTEPIEQEPIPDVASHNAEPANDLFAIMMQPADAETVAQTESRKLPSLAQLLGQAAAASEAAREDQGAREDSALLVPSSVVSPKQEESAAISIQIVCEGEDELQYTEGGYRKMDAGELLNGRFRAVCKLGWGEFSIVWLALDIMHKRFVAAKISKAAGSFLGAARDEVLMLRRITDMIRGDPRHGNVPISLLYESFETQSPSGTHCVAVMDLCGPNLLKLVASHEFRGLPLRVVKAIVRRVAEALDFLHSKAALVHADLKPENVLLRVPDKALLDQLRRFTTQFDEDDFRCAEDAQRRDLATLSNEHIQSAFDVRLADLGTTRPLSKRETRPRVAKPILLQTREYRAPEVVLGISESELTGALDVWSLAAMTFELVTGSFLFDPKAYANHPSFARRFNMDSFHLSLFMQFLGPIPPHLISRSLHFDKFFESREQNTIFKGIALQHTPLSDYTWKYFSDRFTSRLECESFVDFLKSMLSFDPASRASASTILKHPWIQ